MKVKLLKDLVMRQRVAKAGEVVDIEENRAKYLISEGRVKAYIKLKDLKTNKKTKELKNDKKTK